MSRALTPALKANAKTAFLEALSAGLTVADAAAAAGIAVRTAYKWRSGDKRFATEWEPAYAAGGAALEAEATKRAVDGVKRGVYWGGKLIGHQIEYSDTLLIFLLKARDPERFCDRVRAAKIAADNARRLKEAEDDAPKLRKEAEEALRMLSELAAMKATQSGGI